MKLSENTIEILKNFSQINAGLFVKKGNVLRTICTNNNVMASAIVEETFPRDFAIYDLNKMLGILSMYKGQQAEVEIEENQLSFLGLGKITQRFCVPNLIHGWEVINKDHPPAGADTCDVEFNLSQETHSWILSVASILSCPNLVIKQGDGGLSIFATDIKGKVVDHASVKVSDDDFDTYPVIFNIENLKILKGAYRVRIGKYKGNGLSEFTHKDKKLTYWIAFEGKEKK